MDSLDNTNSSDREESKGRLDISNADIRQIVLQNGLEVKTYNELIDLKKDRKKKYEENHEKLSESNVRKWMAKHGKKHLINFDDKERSKLKQYFNSLDDDGSGSIGVDELVEPLISLGLAESIEEVQKVVDSVDDDKSGQIEFKEFLKIIGSSDSSEKSSGIIDFFKQMIKGKLAGGQISNNLPFHLIVSTVRRKKMIDSIRASNIKDKELGEKVLNSYARYLAIKKQAEEQEKEGDSPTKERKKEKMFYVNMDFSDPI